MITVMKDLDEEHLEQLEQTLGYSFQNKELLRRALRHGSAELAKNRGTYQRLEFLGDAVLGHVIALMLFNEKPAADEGILTKMRSHLVRSVSLAEKAAWLGLDGWIQVGLSEERSRGRERPAMLEDVFEAVLGAIAVDGGWGAAHQFVEEQFLDDLRDMDEKTLMLADAKSALSVAAQARGLALPEYIEVLAGGSDHAPLWAFTVSWDGEVVARGEGRTKREAQQQAARRALIRLGLLPEDETSR